MYKRLILLPNNKTFFLFGQRGTGKTTLLKEQLGESALEISLLDSKHLIRLTKAPWELKSLVLAKKAEQTIVVIDEIQKVPALLDEVHKLIEEEKIVFALTGSSARKLMRAGVNLLGGRAFVFKLFPLTATELASDFDLDQVLRWGALPQVVTEKKINNKEEYLYAYVNTYLKEEIILEQVVRQIEPFSRFLEVAAQSNSDPVSFANIAKDVGISAVSVKNYFDIITDTLIGFFLPSYHTSIRKKQKQAAKFYFYDIGLVRTLQNNISLVPSPESFEYGMLFESFIINEIVRLNEYNRTRFELSHFRIDDNEEIDLIIEKPGGKTILIEIKSKDKNVSEKDVKILNRIGANFKNATSYCLSRDPERKKIGQVLCVPWQDGIKEIFNV